MSAREWRIAGLAVGRTYTIWCRRTGEDEAGLTKAVLREAVAGRGMRIAFRFEDLLARIDSRR